MQKQQGKMLKIKAIKQCLAHIHSKYISIHNIKYLSLDTSLFPEVLIFSFSLDRKKKNNQQTQINFYITDNILNDSMWSKGYIFNHFSFIMGCFSYSNKCPLINTRIINASHKEISLKVIHPILLCPLQMSEIRSALQYSWKINKYKFC